MREEINDILQSGIIEPATGEWSLPVASYHQEERRNTEIAVYWWRCNTSFRQTLLYYVIPL